MLEESHGPEDAGTVDASGNEHSNTPRSHAFDTDPVLSALTAADPAASEGNVDVAQLLTEVRARVSAYEQEPRPGFFAWATHPGRLIPASLAACAALTLVAGAAFQWGRVSGVTVDEAFSASVESLQGSQPYRDAVGSLRSGPGQFLQPDEALAEEKVASPSFTTGAMSSVYPATPHMFLVAGSSLPNSPGQAPAYVPDTDGLSADLVAKRLSKYLPVEGEPRREYGSTVTGPIDGSGPSLWVYEDSLLSWSFSDPTRTPWSCAVAEPAPAPAPDQALRVDGATGSPAQVTENVPSSTGVGSSGVAPDASPSCGNARTPLPQEKVQEQAELVLTSLGVPLSSVEWAYGADTQSATTWLTGHQLVDGVRTQQTWGFTFDHEALAFAAGPSAGWARTRDFATVGAREAVERSRDPMFASFGPSYWPGQPVAALAEDLPAVPEVASGADTSRSQGTAARMKDAKVQVAVSPVTVTGAKVTVTPYWQPDGSVMLLPAYLVSATDGQVFALVSIASEEVEWVYPDAED